nr:transposase [Streptomyces sp. NBC_00995]
MRSVCAEGVSARRPARNTPTTSTRTCGAHIWSPSHFAASCGGAPLSVIKEYTEQQRRPT